jgi:hypothetical protein
MAINHELFDEVMRLALLEADNARVNAGMSGSFHDGGASAIENAVKFFKYGLDRKIPPEWDKYRKIAVNNKDPEYAIYLKLKEKFKE